MARPRKPPLDPSITKQIRALHRKRANIRTIALATNLTEWKVKLWIDEHLINMGKDPAWKPIGAWPKMMKFEDDPRAIKSSGVIIVRPVYASEGGFAGVSTLASSYRAKR